jgi:hypothetical protein
VKHLGGIHALGFYEVFRAIVVIQQYDNVAHVKDYQDPVIFEARRVHEAFGFAK